MQKSKDKHKKVSVPSLSQTLKRVTNHPAQTRSTTANLLSKASLRVFDTQVFKVR